MVTPITGQTPLQRAMGLAQHEMTNKREDEMESGTCPTKSLLRMRSSATIQEAAQMMCDLSIGALGVDDGNHQFLGLVTERDLMWAMAQGKHPSETMIADIVNDFPIIVDGPVSASTAAARMIAGHVRHLLIRVDGALQIVSLRDLMADEVDVPTDARHLISASEMRRTLGLDARTAPQD